MKKSSVFSVLLICGAAGACASQSAAPPLLHVEAVPPLQAEATPPPPPPSQAVRAAEALPPLPPPPPPAPRVDEAPPQPQKTQATFQLERYIGVDSSNWKPPTNPQSFSDLYTRLELHSDAYQAGSTPPEAPTVNVLRDYKKEKPGWVAQLLSTDTDSVTTLAAVQIANPQLKMSVPLFSITHTSGTSNGNNWSTDFTASYVQSPLFLVGPNTAITIDLTTSVSRDVKSQGTSLAVSAVTQAVKIANPSSALLTSLSSSTVNSAATAIDTALSGLLSQDIAEDIQLGRFANRWEPGSNFRFYGCAPFARGEDQMDSTFCGQKEDIDGHKDVEVGVWTLSLECPRLSAFDPSDVCHSIGDDKLADKATVISLAAPDIAKARNAIAADVIDSQILQFALSTQVTVSSFAQSQTWFTTFTTGLTAPPAGAAAAAAAKKPDYGSFCAGAVVSFESNGLSRFDAELALRALVRNLAQFVPVKSQFAAGQDGAACVPFAPGSTGFQ